MNLLYADYFKPNPTSYKEFFGRPFGMSRGFFFLRVVNFVEDADDYFKLRMHCCGKLSACLIMIDHMLEHDGAICTHHDEDDSIFQCKKINVWTLFFLYE